MSDELTDAEMLVQAREMILICQKELSDRDEKIEKMKKLLTRALKKLREYHRFTNGIYTGTGENLGWLTPEMEEALEGKKP